MYDHKTHRTPTRKLSILIEKLKTLTLTQVLLLTLIVILLFFGVQLWSVGSTITHYVSTIQNHPTDFLEDLFFRNQGPYTLSTLIKSTERIILADMDTAPRVLIDVSGDGEFGMIYKYMTQHKLSIPRTVVDIGANDCIVGSNSFNLIELGWAAYLVDPLPDNNKKCREVLEGFIWKKQSISILPYAVGDEDKQATFFIYPHANLQMASLDSSAYGLREGQEYTEVQVEVKSVVSLGKELPKEIGVLSVDAEGVEEVIVRQFMELGYKPAFVVVEVLRVGEEKIQSLLKDYVKLGKTKFNSVYVHKNHHEG
eukprot:TRINITY_DN7047_c0_g1_i1.p1 TRINITY_DN7047_c0_g1~~TRINITY_DN7047_c0_g1_i1.p1  ORF type:complete len:323 (-),score=63.37 TRINITY_DN7047_c0_g1_i1:95-1027(-)